MKKLTENFVGQVLHCLGGEAFRTVTLMFPLTVKCVYQFRPRHFVRYMKRDTTLRKTKKKIIDELK